MKKYILKIPTNLFQVKNKWVSLGYICNFIENESITTYAMFSFCLPSSSELPSSVLIRFFKLTFIFSDLARDIIIYKLIIQYQTSKSINKHSSGMNQINFFRQHFEIQIEYLTNKLHSQHRTSVRCESRM